MLSSAWRVGRNGAVLKPFVLRLRDGFLVGSGMESEQGTPCIQCAELWLTQRKVWTERINPSELTIRKDILATVAQENNAHVFYEISADGSATRMDCLVFPHPDCRCNKTNYCPPAQPSSRVNFAFSPVYQIKCARYGTPSGNLWLTHATGLTPLAQGPIEVYAADRERESSRRKAVDEWMKQAAFADLSSRWRMGQEIIGQNLRSESLERILVEPKAQLFADGMGAGATWEEGVLSGILSLAKARTLRKFTNTGRTPMLVVGTTNWVRGRVPFFLLQQYDIHLLFYPNSTPSWVVGICALSRQDTEQQPVFSFGGDTDIQAAFDAALGKLLEQCRPSDWKLDEARPEVKTTESERKNTQRLNRWWNNWVYRCPKISLKDILHLESYSRDLDFWKNYFLDGQEKIHLVKLNSPLLPERLRTLVKVQSESSLMVTNVQGIGTIRSFGREVL